MSYFRLFQLKKFADYNFKFDENGGSFSFSHSLFKRLLQKHVKKTGLVWERVDKPTDSSSFGPKAKSFGIGQA